MPILSHLAQKKKIDFFFPAIPNQAAILEIGNGSGWAGDYLKCSGRIGYRCIDLNPPADIVGDIGEWKTLGLAPESFDFIIAFEVVEHVDIYPACEALLKPGGSLLVTTPLPHADWIMKTLEYLGLNQKRTSPHSNLHYLRSTGSLERQTYRIVAGLSQWGIFRKRIQ
jgi:SAM-dependent methyltransferase